MAESRWRHGWRQRVQAIPSCAWQLAATLAAVLYALLMLYWAGVIAGAYTVHPVLFPVGKDFVNIFTAAHLIDAQELSILFDPVAYSRWQSAWFGQQFPPYHYIWSYPPTALFVAVPFAFLPYYWAYAAWAAATFGSCGIACHGLWPRLGRSESLALALAPATAVNLFFGQNGHLMTALLVGGLRLVDRRPILAGVVLGLLSIKPQLGLIAPVALVAGRHWRALASAILTALALAAAAGAVFGWETWRAFAEVTLPLQRYAMTIGTGSFLYFLVTPFASFRLLGLPLAAGEAIQMAITLGTAVVAYVALRRDRDPEYRLMVVLTGAFLVAPYLLAYDMVALAVACLCLANRLAASGAGGATMAVIGVGWILPILVPMLNGFGCPVVPLIIAAMFVLAVRTRVVNSAAPAVVAPP